MENKVNRFKTIIYSWIDLKTIIDWFETRTSVTSSTKCITSREIDSDIRKWWTGWQMADCHSLCKTVLLKSEGGNNCKDCFPVKKGRIFSNISLINCFKYSVFILVATFMSKIVSRPFLCTNRRHSCLTPRLNFNRPLFFLEIKTVWFSNLGLYF